MRRRPALAGALLLGPWLLQGALAAAPAAAGRWTGQAEIPGAALPMVVDLQPGADKAWVGSVILPGRGIKGAPLADIQVDDQGVRFSLAAAFGGDLSPTSARVELRWQPDGRLAGEFHQAGHRAALVLTRTGAAQVDLPPPVSLPGPDLLGTWRGRYQLGGYPRDVTVTLTREPGSRVRGELVILGRRRSVLPIDQVHQGRGFVTLHSSQAGVRIEGRLHSAERRIDGHFLQGPFEAELVLRQAVEGAVP
jgi:hypothetical protein